MLEILAYRAIDRVRNMAEKAIHLVILAYAGNITVHEGYIDLRYYCHGNRLWIK